MAATRRAAPRITIVTPSLNQAEFIEQAIESVLAQGYPNLDYIIIDGGSTDGTVEILNRYADRCAYCVSEPDGGQSDALIKGFARATGEIWGWLCADDVLMPAALETVARACPAEGWLIGSGKVLDAAGVPGVTVAHGRYRRGDVLFNGYVLTQVSVFWRASLYRRVRGLDRGLHYCMDWDLWTQFESLLAPRVIPDVLAGFRVHPAQKTASLDRMWEEIRSVRREILRGRTFEHAVHRVRWKVSRQLARCGIGAGVGHTYLEDQKSTAGAP